LIAIVGVKPLRSNIFYGLAALGLLSAAPAGAATLIDQEAIVPVAGQGTSQVSAGVRNLGGQLRDIRYVQTVTAGLNGSLAALELQGFRAITQPAHTLRLTLIDGDYAAGARSAVGSRDIDAQTLPLFSEARTAEKLLIFDTQSFNFAVKAGQMFSVVFQVIPLGQLGSISFITANTFGQEQLPNGMFRTITEGANYSRGGLYQLSSTGQAVALSHDIGFRSLVNVAAVPEPSTWAMLILGFGLAGAAVRRRSQRVAIAA
jgi:hypothetical protein